MVTLLCIPKELKLEDFMTAVSKHEVEPVKKEGTDDTYEIKCESVKQAYAISDDVDALCESHEVDFDSDDLTILNAAI